MSKQVVVDVGNCGPDHNSIRRMLQKRYDVDVIQCDGVDDTLDRLRSGPVSLVLINRKLDADYSDGMEVLKRIKAEPAVQTIPVMLITNYPEHQQAAVDLGAEWGFGKLQLDTPATHERLSKFLAPHRQTDEANASVRRG